MRRTARLLAPLFLALPVAAAAQEASADTEQTAGEQSPYVGRYDGSSFETAMGMVVRPDGTFQWGISVGSLDLRAMGTWRENGDLIVFKSDPKPVPAEFIWKGTQPREQDGPFLRIVWAGSGKPFDYADVRGLCANGDLIRSSVSQEGWSPHQECDRPKTIQLFMDSYQVLSPVFELSGARAIASDETVTFEFHRNDLGLLDFDGVTGRLENGTLRMERPIGAMTLRKVEAPAE